MTETRIDERVTSVPPTADAPTDTEVRDTGSWLREPIAGSWAAGVGISWYVLWAIATRIEPPTHHEVPVVGAVIGGALVVAMMTMVVGLVTGRRWGLVAAVGASVLLVAASVACPTTGHHPIGWWWLGQMACATALVGISVTALRRA